MDCASTSVDPLMLVLQLQWVPVPRATTAELMPPSGVCLIVAHVQSVIVALNQRRLIVKSGGEMFD